MNKNAIDTGVSGAEDLKLTLQKIGIARFVGRINSGVIPSSEGYDAVEAYVDNAQQRPFLSKLTSALLNRADSYAHR